MQRIKTTSLNKMFAEMNMLDWAALDRQINKDTGTWKRVQAISGIPRSEETKSRISDALMGHSVSSITRQKISKSLREYHAKRRAGGSEADTAPVVRAPSSTWPKSVAAWKVLMPERKQEPS